MTNNRQEDELQIFNTLRKMIRKNAFEDGYMEAVKTLRKLKDENMTEWCKAMNLRTVPQEMAKYLEDKYNDFKDL